MQPTLRKMMFFVALFVVASFYVSPALAAIDLSEPLSTEDEEAFDEILEPLMKIYNFVKYMASILAGLMLVWAGIMFVISGQSTGQREQAKNTAMYVVIGLVVIWIAPLMVNFLVQ